MNKTETIDEFRGDVAMELRERGYEDLADYYGSIPNEVAEEDHAEANGDAEGFAVDFIRFVEEE